MIIHNVGNKVKGESLEISTEICDANNEVTNQYLKQFFFSTFKFDVTYRFVHETDIAMNEIYNYVKHIFENPSEFYEQSVNIAKHLYEVSVHPNIKAGELYIVYLQNCIIDDNVTDAIGIYKSESKDYYLQVNSILRNWIKVVLYLICQIQIIRYILWIEILMMLCIGKRIF